MVKLLDVPYRTELTSASVDAFRTPRPVSNLLSSLPGIKPSAGVTPLEAKLKIEEAL